jgi:hypothetical protein
MRRQKAKVVKKRRPKIGWNSLVVASVDSLPNGVFLLFVTSAKSATVAAQRKAGGIGIPGEVTVVDQHPLNRVTGKNLYIEMLNSLKPFPYGGSDCLVKSTTVLISRKYMKLSSKDPDQIELRKQLFEQQVEEQLTILDEIRNKHGKIVAKIDEKRIDLERLESEKASLLESIRDNKKVYKEKSDELHVVDELWQKKEDLQEEVYDLEARVSELREEHASRSELQLSYNLAKHYDKSDE